MSNYHKQRAAHIINEAVKDLNRLQPGKVVEAVVISDYEVKFRFRHPISNNVDVADLVIDAGAKVDSMSTVITTDVTNACVEAGLVANKYYY